MEEKGKEKQKDILSAEERAEIKILASHMKTIIYYYNEIDKKLKEQNEKLEKLDEKIGVILRK